MMAKERDIDIGDIFEVLTDLNETARRIAAALERLPTKDDITIAFLVEKKRELDLAERAVRMVKAYRGDETTVPLETAIAAACKEPKLPDLNSA